MNNYVYSPSVSNLGGIMEPMDMQRLDYIGPLIATPDNRVVSITDSGYGVSRQQYRTRLASAPNLNGGIADIAATFNMLDLFLGRK